MSIEHPQRPFPMLSGALLEELLNNWKDDSYTIYADESLKSGVKYSYFFGGIFIPSKSVRVCENYFREIVYAYGISGEIKWANTSPDLLERYKSIATEFIRLVSLGVVRLRISYYRNSHLNPSIYRHDDEVSYLKVYHNFILHGFALKKAVLEKPVQLVIGLDELPVGKLRGDLFADILLKIPNQWVLDPGRCLMKECPFVMTRDNVMQVNSKASILMQLVDLMAGSYVAMTRSVRGHDYDDNTKRGMAKRALSNHIADSIRKELLPQFDLHSNCNVPGPWFQTPYRHWIVEAKSRNE
jgi:hypothetical protein